MRPGVRLAVDGEGLLRDGENRSSTAHTAAERAA